MHAASRLMSGLIVAEYRGNAGRSSTIMARFWTHHWVHRDWRDDINPEYQPLRHAASNSFRQRGVSPGDMVYVVSIADGHLLLGGRMTVKGIVSRDEAVRALRRDNLWEAEEHVICEESDGTRLNLRRALAPPLS